MDASSPRLRYNLLIMSYESLRADIDWVASRRWLYCVLDEGHAIRNPRSRVTMACKKVMAQHRCEGNARGGASASGSVGGMHVLLLDSVLPTRVCSAEGAEVHERSAPCCTWRLQILYLWALIITLVSTCGHCLTSSAPI